jgi:hypothetical protein
MARTGKEIAMRIILNVVLAVILARISELVALALVGWIVAAMR